MRCLWTAQVRVSLRAWPWRILNRSFCAALRAMYVVAAAAALIFCFSLLFLLAGMMMGFKFFTIHRPIRGPTWNLEMEAGPGPERISQATEGFWGWRRIHRQCTEVQWAGRGAWKGDEIKWRVILIFLRIEAKFCWAVSSRGAWVDLTLHFCSLYPLT